MRLTAMLLSHPLGATPATHALAALMCLDAARLPARIDASGHLVGLFDQDRAQWDQELLTEGLGFLALSAAGCELSEYHLEAAIAAIHACTPRTEDTDWETIVSLYDRLMTLRRSPIVALNRAIAVAQHNGPEHGIEAIRAIPDRDRLTTYPFYSAALGELELRCGRPRTAGQHFRVALALARSAMEREFLERRLGASERAGVRRVHYE